MQPLQQEQQRVQLAASVAVLQVLLHTHLQQPVGRLQQRLPPVGSVEELPSVEKLHLKEEEYGTPLF